MLTLLLAVGCSDSHQQTQAPERASAPPAPTTPASVDLTAAIDALPLHDRDAVRAFYAARANAPAWLGPECEARLDALRAEVEAAATHGLTPAHYHAGALAQTGCDANGEVLASDAWMALASDLYRGRVDRVTVEPHWNLPRRPFNGPAVLESALHTTDAVDYLSQLAPQDAYYLALQEMLALHRQMAARGGWPGVSPGRKLQLGDQGERVDELRRRLAASELIEEPVVAPGLAFDAALEEAVKTFQRRNNLEPDGVVGASTLAQLNKSAEDRIAQLRVNLERWRWMPPVASTREVRVFIADFRLETWDKNGLVREHKVIVGKRYRNTPSFAGEIKRIVFAPRWHVPRRLLVEDKLPLFQQDPSAFHRLGYELLDTSGELVQGEIDWHAYTADNFPYQLRQRPGAANALGEVKILFPNKHDVYLHDTPTKELFSKVRRDFSSGCIRVENALGLAEWLLQDGERWNRKTMEAAVAKAKETSVTLAEKVPVFIMYLTVGYDEHRYVRFLEDIYERDAAVLQALDAA